MFGFGKPERTVSTAEKHFKLMIAGLAEIHGKPIPNQVFADAYVYAFFQQLVMLSVLEVFGKAIDPVKAAAIMAAALDRIVPGYGIEIVKSASTIANPSNSMYQHYSIGNNEGKQLTIALMNDDLVTQHEMMKSFRDYVVRNYISPDN